MDYYYHFKDFESEIQFTLGRFLAKDFGGRVTYTRSFESGLELTLWYTVTNLEDFINGNRYFDKGVSFSMPLDMFYMSSSRKTWGYGMSDWSRDVGQRAITGKSLYSMIRDERRY